MDDFGPTQKLARNQGRSRLVEFQTLPQKSPSPKSAFSISSECFHEKSYEGKGKREKNIKMEKLRLNLTVYQI